MNEKLRMTSLRPGVQGINLREQLAQAGKISRIVALSQCELGHCELYRHIQ